MKNQFDLLRICLTELPPDWKGVLDWKIGCASIRITWDRERSFEVDVLLCDQGVSLSLVDDMIIPYGKCAQSLDLAKSVLMSAIDAIEKRSELIDAFRTEDGVRSYIESRLERIRVVAKNTQIEKQNTLLDQLWKKGLKEEFAVQAKMTSDLNRINSIRLKSTLVSRPAIGANPKK